MRLKTPIPVVLALFSTGCVGLQLSPSDRLEASYPLLRMQANSPLMTRRYAPAETIAQVQKQKRAQKPQVARTKPRASHPYPVGPIRVDIRQRERRRVADAALALVGLEKIRVGKRSFPNDCSGFARAVYASRGIDLYRTASSTPGDNGVKVIHAFTTDRRGLHRRTYPFIGDLVFFHNTYDRNRNGSAEDDPLTHIGVVEHVDDDGTVHFVHRISGGIVRQRVNLRHPGRHQVDGKVVNDFLRRRGKKRLSGQMFAQFGTVIR